MIRQPEAKALQSSPGAMVAVGDDGLIAFANVEALRLLGWDHNLIGKPISAMVPESLREKQREAYSNFTITREVTTYPRVQPALGQDGRIRHVHVHVGAFLRPDGSLFLCSAMSEPHGRTPSLDVVADILRVAGYEQVDHAGDWRPSPAAPTTDL